MSKVQKYKVSTRLESLFGKKYNLKRSPSTPSTPIQ